MERAPKRQRTISGTRVLAIALALVPAITTAQPEDETVVVATALPFTHSIAAALAEGTPIEVRHLPERAQRMGQLPSFFERQAETLAEQLADVDAVVTIGKLWNDDPLYTAARAGNIRVVDIDATKPWSIQLEGVAIAAEPVTNAVWAEIAGTDQRAASIFFWQSPANGARAAEIVGRDLMRLVPNAAPRIERNLRTLRSELIDLQTEYQLELAELPDLTVAALAPEFIYLTNAFGIYVDSYFLKQDIDWTEADLEAFTRYLDEDDIRVVVHKWEPNATIAEAIEAAGAELVVLDPIDLGIVEDGQIAPDSYQRLLSHNLEVLYSTLARMQ
jgi:ABC-type Zn uptake system ZnuABC Zn-binding protein ZnuA